MEHNENLSIASFLVQLAQILQLYQQRHQSSDKSMDKKTTMRIKIIPSESNNNPSDKQIYSNFSRTSEPSPQFNQLVEMFKIFMKTATEKSYPQSNNSELEPRDRHIKVATHKYNSLSEEKELSMNEWVTELFKTVHSSAFNYYSKNEMNFEHTKIFCAQNILKNLVSYAKEKKIGSQQLINLNRFIKNKILKYLKCKYPITESKEVNKKLSEMVCQVNKIEAPNNNYIEILSVPFTYREDGNYQDLIMRMINQLMKKMDSPLAAPSPPTATNQKTLYQQFQDCMNQIFDRAYDQDVSKDSKQTKDCKENKLTESLFQTHKLQSLQSIGLRNSSTSQIQKYIQGSKQSKQKQNYKAKVKQYTSSQIGRKVPENVPLFTQKQIQSKNMTIKHPAILRILVKWCLQLWEKFDEPNYYTSRSESVKTQTGGYMNTLIGWMRKEIDSRLAVQKEAIQEYKAQLIKNNNQMQGKTLQHELAMDGDECLQDAEKISGKFACKVVKNMQKVTIAYLNRLIHGTLKVSKQFYNQSSLANTTGWPSPPNLLSFKLGDIMRCKCSSKQKEILQIFKEIKRISSEDPNKLKIIRIKNRLKSGTNDILINIKFKNQIICQIQLAINTKISSFIKCSNAFNHYLYELERSEMGPLTELCSIWNNLDNRMSIYQSLIEEETSNQKSSEYACGANGKLCAFRKYENPFICSKCFQAYYQSNYLIDHLKCENCNYLICANCDIENKSVDELKKVIKDKRICEIAHRKLKRGEPLPRHGACLLIESKICKLERFMYVRDKTNQKEQLFGVNSSNQIYEIQSISTKAQLKDFRRKHLVFEVKDEHALKLNLSDISYYNLRLKVKANYSQEREIISLMDFGLDTNQCKNLIDIGTTQQKKFIKCMFLVDNKLDRLPLNALEFHNLKWLTLSRNPFKSFKGLDKLPQLRKLYLKSMQLQQIPLQIYHCGRLYELNLYDNKITRISDEIRNLKELSNLDLTCNHISVISDSIRQCKKLGELSLSVNKLQYLPAGFFQLPKLHILALQNNNLKEIPAQLSQLSNLKELYLSYNPDITSLPPSLVKLIHLKILDCGMTSISQLPQNFHQLKNLNELALQNTKIKKLSHCFQNLQNLQILNITSFTDIQNCRYLVDLNQLEIRQCRLLQLPRWLGELRKLQNLDISDNSLQSIDTDILWNLTELVCLKATNNKLHTFPDIRSCTKLTFIDLEGNQITKIQGYLLESSLNLQHVILSNNQLNSLPFSFSHLDRLTELRLRNNKLTSLIEESQTELLNSSEKPVWPQLRKVDLGHNMLRQVPIYLFKCPNILDLVIANNQITSLPSQLKFCKKLKLLKMQSNLFTELPEAIRQLTHLQKIYVQGNKISQIPQWAKDHIKTQNNQEGFNFVTRLVDSLLTVKEKTCPTIKIKKKGGNIE